MKDPIPVERDMSREEVFHWQKQKHEQRMQWAFMSVLGIIALSFVIPFGLWLSRLALGG